MRASNQWAFRPSDERFWNLKELHEATLQHRESASEATVILDEVRVEAVGESLQLTGRQGIPAKFTNWSFGQLASIAQAPGSYLRTLPATLAAQNINHGLKNRDNGTESRILVSRREVDNDFGGFEQRIRAFTSDRYARIWNHEIVERLIELPSEWRVPPARPANSTDPRARPATEDDVLERRSFLSIKVGDLIAPAGLYASEEDMFAFLVDESRPINDGTEEGLARGFFITNSEVGKASFKVTTFLYRHVCGNHIIWDAKDVHEIKIRHVGTAPAKAFSQLKVELVKYSEASASVDEARIESAKSFKIAASIHDVVDFIFQKKILSRSNATAAYELAEEHNEVDGDPRSAWGFSQGITRLSQEHVNADARVALDRAAGKVLQLGIGVAF
jgi:hypothetical protein